MDNETHNKSNMDESEIKHEYRAQNEQSNISRSIIEKNGASANRITQGGSDSPRELLDASIDRKTRTLWGDAFSRLSKNKLAMISLIWIIIVAVAAITAKLWVPRLFGDPTIINTQLAITQRFSSPSFAHWFGTDDMGRDIFGRVIYGARVSLTVGIFATLTSLSIGVFLGAISGFYGKAVDAIIMRITDIFLAFPYILFAILVMSVLPSQYKGVSVVVAVIGLLGWSTFARLFRSSVLSVKENDYVAAGRALGASNARLMFKHILPNAIAPAVVYATMGVGGAILTESALSFLGIGIQPPTVSWGRMIDDGRMNLTDHPTMVLFPGLAILLTVLAFTLLGDGVRDALDVKMED
jgi:peptide/nickel transport system permease protein/oligopeptide transport system permease protein